MNLSQLRAFDAVAHTGSFTAAARRLYVSQPAVTAHVRALEEYYEVSLFRRRGRGVEPTELGAELAAVSHRLFALEDEAADVLRANKALARGSLRISADSPYFLVPFVASFRARFPGVHLKLSVANAVRIQEDLLEERCDLTVQGELRPDERLHAETIARHGIVVFCHADHPWARAGRRTLRLAELHGRPMILREEGSTTRRHFEAACRESGVQPTYTLETTSRETVKEAVAAGLGIGVISAPEMRPDPRLWPMTVSDTPLATTEYVLCLQRRMKLRVIRAFLDTVHEVKPRWADATPPWEVEWTGEMG